MGCGASAQARPSKVVPLEAAPIKRKPGGAPGDELGDDSVTSLRAVVRGSGRQARVPGGAEDEVGQQTVVDSEGDRGEGLADALAAAQRTLHQQEHYIDPNDEAYLIVRRDMPAEELRDVLNAELAKLEPYGPVASPGGPTRDARGSRTVEAQEVMIARLDAELADARANAAKLQEALDRRVRKARVSLAQHRAEAQTEISELKQQLAAKIAECDTLRSGSAAAGPGGGASTALVVSLSQQIADLDADLKAARDEVARLQGLSANEASAPAPPNEHVACASPLTK